MKKRVYLGLGSNLGDRQAYLQQALEALHTKEVQILRIASVYETAAVEVTNQPDFLNTVVEADTTLLPLQLLARTSSVERQLGGRNRPQPKGARTVDVDILLFGRAVIDTPQLQVPHPRMTGRRFVLEPLVELAPELRDPITNQLYRELLPATARQFLRRTTTCRLSIPLG